MLNPFTLMIGALVLLLLMIEDYVSFTQGKETLFGDMWKMLDSDDGPFDKIKESLGKLGESVTNLLESAGELMVTLGGEDGKNAIDGITKAFDGLATVLDVIATSLLIISELIAGIFDTDPRGFTQPSAFNAEEQGAAYSGFLDNSQGKNKDKAKIYADYFKDVQGKKIGANYAEYLAKAQEERSEPKAGYEHKVINQDVVVNIDGSKDPNAVAYSVLDLFKNRGLNPIIQ